MTGLLSRIDLPPVWLALHGLVALVLNDTKPFGVFGSNLAGAAILFACGLGLIGWSALHFLRRRTPIEPRHAPRSLITGGPFRINRNPIYTGMWLILVGWGLALGSLGALLPSLVFPIVITRRFIRGEEALLREAFGAEADAWIARSRRW